MSNFFYFILSETHAVVYNIRMEESLSARTPHCMRGTQENNAPSEHFGFLEHRRIRFFSISLVFGFSCRIYIYIYIYNAGGYATKDNPTGETNKHTQWRTAGRNTSYIDILKYRVEFHSSSCFLFSSLGYVLAVEENGSLQQCPSTAPWVPWLSHMDNYTLSLSLSLFALLLFLFLQLSKNRPEELKKIYL